MAKFLIHIDGEDIEIDDVQQALEEQDFTVLGIEPVVDESLELPLDEGQTDN